MPYRFIVFILLMIVWMFLSGKTDAFHITLGMISSALVAWISSDLFFEDRQTSLGRRLKQLGRLSAYLCWLLYQIVLANLHILRLALTPSGTKEVAPSIVRYDCKLKSDFEKFLLANSITLTPGTVTVKILGDEFYIHAISEVAAQGLDGEMERRIAEIFAD